MNTQQNKDITGVWIGGLIGLLGLICAVFPGASGMDMMSQGFGIMTIGIFIIIVGLVTAAVFWQRARAMGRILAGENILARWVYSEAQSRQQVLEEFNQQKGNNRSTYLIVFAWFVVIGGAFLGWDLLTTGEINWAFAFLFFGVLFLITLTALLAPILWRRQALKSSREVIFARDGLVLNGVLHSWARPLNRLVSVRWDDAAAEKTLVFEISSLNKTSVTMYSTYIISVPVPPGKENEAQKVLEYFSPAPEI